MVKFKIPVIFLGLLILAGCGQLIGPINKILVSPPLAKMAPGATQQFAAIGRDQYNNIISISPAWSVTGGIGTISGTGLFTATAEGSGTVVASVEGISGTAKVVVTTKGGIYGTITDLDGNKVGSLLVSVSGEAYSSHTDSKGQYSILDVPPGKYTVVTEDTKDYLSTSREATVSTSVLTLIDFILIPRVLVISENIDEDLSGFVYITGQVKNNGQTRVTLVKLTYVLDDLYGYPVSQGSAYVDGTDIPAGQSANFTVTPFPPLPLSEIGSHTRTITIGSY